MDLARVFAREKNFRVGVRILSETISAKEAGVGFSVVANVVIARLLEIVQATMQTKYGNVRDGSCILLGLGKLGGAEMTATSDLDIMLIYDHDEHAELSVGPHPLAPSQYYAKLTQLLVTALTALTAEGQLYEVDMRLRPSGSKGPLAVSRASFETYQENEAWTWEHMALTRAHVVAGDAGLAKNIGATIHRTLAAPRDSEKIKTDIAEMRALMLREHKNAGPWDLKLAQGGQVEIEFIAQYLQLIHADKKAEILSPNTAASLTATAKAGLLRAVDAEILLQALALYQRLTHLLRLCINGEFKPETAPAHLLATLSFAAAQPNISATEAYLIEKQEAVAALFSQMLGRA